MDKMNKPFQYKLEQFIDTVKDNGKILIIAAAATATLVVGFFGYRWNRHRNEEFAHRAFTAVLKKFEASVGSDQSSKMSADAVTFKTNEEKWTAVEAACKQGYAEYGSAGLAPMFLVFESTALFELGKYEEALALLKTAINLISSPEVKDCYRIKYALMQLDSGKEALVTEGLELLNKISFEIGSAAYDQALYQLGYYYWTQNNFEKAKSYWQQYIVKYSGVAEFDHHVRFIQAKLDLIAE